MPDQFTPGQRSKIMARVKSKNTTPERLVRQALHAQGFRFRLHRSDLPGVPDLAFPRYRVAVFVNGCFWHWHGCKRSRMPKTNRDYWERKLSRNVTRDGETRQMLKDTGWHRFDIWECDLSAGIETLVAELHARANSSGS